jgi:PAS domain S-box-containing protein
MAVQDHYRWLIEPPAHIVDPQECIRVRTLAAVTLVVTLLYAMVALVFAAVGDPRIGWLLLNLAISAALYGFTRTRHYQISIMLLPAAILIALLGLSAGNPRSQAGAVVIVPLLIAGFFWPPRPLIALAVVSALAAIWLVSQTPDAVSTIIFLLAVVGVQTAVTVFHHRLRHALQQRTDELTSSELRYRAIVENSPDAYYLLRTAYDAQQRIHDFEIIDVNEAGTKQLNQPREVLVGTTLKPRPEVWVARLFEGYRTVVESGQPYSEELKITADDGRQHWWYAILAVPLGDGVAVISREMTERKRAEEALRESQAWLQATIKSLPFDFWAMDVNGRYVLQNEHARETWGNNVGKLPEEIDLPGSVLEEWKTLNERAFAGEEIRAEVTYNRQGRQQYNYNVVVPVRDGERIIGIAGVDIDITETKQMEAKLRALLQAIPDFMARIRRDGTYLEAIHGADFTNMMFSERLVGKKVQEVLPPEIASQRMEAVLRALETGELQSYEYLFETELDDLRQFEARITPSGPDEALVMVRDVTARRQAETHALNLTLERERMELLRRFVGDHTHDLMTPLTIIKTSLYLLSRANSSQRRAEHVAKLQAQVDNLENMIRNMLMILRLDKPIEDEFEFVMQDLNALVARLVADYQPVAVSRGLILQQEMQPSLPLVAFDSEKMERALSNLIDNALKYTDSGGTVIVSTSTAPGGICLSVRDTGRGIPGADLPHVFDRFFRSDHSQTSIGGSGIGLAIVDKIVRAHGGYVEVESAEGQGSTFRIFLPLHVEIENRTG